MITIRLFLSCFISVFIVCCAYAGEGDTNERQPRVSANLEGRAEVTIAFLPGTGFMSWIVARNSETGVLTDFGRFYVDTYWTGYLPVNSTILLGVRGTGAYCYYFQVREPTSAYIEMGGKAPVPDMNIVAGEAIEFKGIHNTHSIQSGRCPEP